MLDIQWHLVGTCRSCDALCFRNDDLERTSWSGGEDDCLHELPEEVFEVKLTESQLDQLSKLPVLDFTEDEQKVISSVLSQAESQGWGHDRD